VFAAAADFDNDGDMDIYVQGSTQSGSTGNYFLVNQGAGHFVGAAQFEQLAGSDYAQDCNAGIGAFASATDFDGDGFIDILTGNGARSANYLLQFGGYSLFRNEGAEGNWVSLALTGGPRNTPAVGAVVELVIDDVYVRRMVNNGQRAYSTEFNGQESPALHFGLGEADTIDRLAIRWTDGSATLLEDVSANRLLRLEQAEAVVATTTRETFQAGGGPFRYVFSGETTSVRGQNDVIRGFGADDELDFAFFNGAVIVGTPEDLRATPGSLLVRVFEEGTADEYVLVNYGGVAAGDFQLRVFGARAAILEAIERRKVALATTAIDLFDAGTDRFVFAYLTMEQSPRGAVDVISSLGAEDRIDLAFFDGGAVVGSVAAFEATPGSLLLRVMNEGGPDEHVLLNFGGLSEDAFELRVLADEATVRSALGLPDAPLSFRVEAEALELAQGFSAVNGAAASGGRFIAAVGPGEQIARHAFAGSAGLYDLAIGHFDENDGVARMAVFVNGAQVDAWLWDGLGGAASPTAASRAVRTVEDLALRAGDVVELRGFGAPGEPLRTDFLDFTRTGNIPAVPAPFRIEAESLALLQGFAVAAVSAASGRGVIAATGSGEQIARAVFAGPAGVYDIGLGHFDENDGVARMAVFVNDAQIDDWRWNGAAGSDRPTPDALAIREIDAVSLRPGDVVELRGFGAPGEPLRTDFLDFAFVHDLLA
jgi:hypothetical protein